LSSCYTSTSTPTLLGMTEPSWQELLRLRLVERNNKESAFAPIIEQCKIFAICRASCLFKEAVSSRSQTCSADETLEGTERILAECRRNSEIRRYFSSVGTRVSVFKFTTVVSRYSSITIAMQFAQPISRLWKRKSRPYAMSLLIFTRLRGRTLNVFYL
jgi:hypothetical protein